MRLPILARSLAGVLLGAAGETDAAGNVDETRLGGGPAVWIPLGD